VKFSAAAIGLAILGHGCSDGRAPVAPPPPPAAEKPRDYTETIPGERKIAFEMVGIPGDGDAIKPFWMGKTEVTWDEFEEYFLAAPEELPEGFDASGQPSKPYEPGDHGWGTGRRPVILISRTTAEMYCRWLSAITKKHYRLPTEAEWEHACRAGSKTRYFFGDDPAALGDYAWFQANSGEKTQEVGQKKPNPWGLYDILGNAMEYVSDPFSKDDDRAVLRGGGWNDPPEALQSSVRRPILPAWYERDPNRPRSKWWYYDGYFLGLRVVRPLEP
jgi:formylglycine-generating enzyme required for sulfatase activity